MSWRDAFDARDVNDFSFKPTIFDSLSQVARGQVLAFATPVQFVDRCGSWNKGPWGLLVTTEEVVLGKPSMFGLKIPFRSPILNFLRYGVGLQGGHGPLYEVAQDLDEGGQISFLFHTSDAAEHVAQFINDAVGGARDPNFAKLNRAMALARAQPPGEVGQNLTPAQVTEESKRARQQFERGEYEQLWKRRVELGYGVESDGVSQSDFFWLDAAPAIAALRLGYRDHPMVAMCCGVAESDYNRADMEQVQAVREFNKLFQGSAPARLQRRLAEDGSSVWTVHHAGQQMPLFVKQQGLRLGEDPILFMTAWSEVVEIEHPTSFAARVVLADGASYQFGFTTPREGSEFAVDAAQYLQLCRRTNAEPAGTQAYQIDIDDRSRWIVHYGGRKQPVVVGSEGIRLGESPASFASRWAEIVNIEYPTSFAARISLAGGATFQFGFTTLSEKAGFANCVSSFRR